MFSALGMPPFRSVKLRSRRAACPACGVEGEKVSKIEETDYVAFCGGERPDWVARGLVEGREDRRIRAKVCIITYSEAGFWADTVKHGQELKTALDDAERRPRILDVRPRTEFGICHIPGSTSKYLDACLGPSYEHDSCQTSQSGSYFRIRPMPVGLQTRRPCMWCAG